MTSLLVGRSAAAVDRACLVLSKLDRSVEWVSYHLDDPTLDTSRPFRGARSDLVDPPWRVKDEGRVAHLLQAAKECTALFVVCDRDPASVATAQFVVQAVSKVRLAGLVQPIFLQDYTAETISAAFNGQSLKPPESNWERDELLLWAISGPISVVAHKILEAKILEAPFRFGFLEACALAALSSNTMRVRPAHLQVIQHGDRSYKSIPQGFPFSYSLLAPVRFRHIACEAAALLSMRVTTACDSLMGMYQSGHLTSPYEASPQLLPRGADPLVAPKGLRALAGFAWGGSNKPPSGLMSDSGSKYRILPRDAQPFQDKRPLMFVRPAEVDILDILLGLFPDEWLFRLATAVDNLVQENMVTVDVDGVFRMTGAGHLLSYWMHGFPDLMVKWAQWIIDSRATPKVGLSKSFIPPFIAFQDTVHEWIDNLDNESQLCPTCSGTLKLKRNLKSRVWELACFSPKCKATYRLACGPSGEKLIGDGLPESL